MKTKKPDPTIKGQRGGNCNRTACQQPGAHWYNPYTYAYYCAPCARELNECWQADNAANTRRGLAPVMTKMCYVPMNGEDLYVDPFC